MASKYAPVRRLLKSNPDLTPTQAARQLGLISDTQELQNKGRGRFGIRNRKADVDRKQNIDDSTRPQTEYQKRRVAQKKVRLRKGGKYEADHEVEVSLTGPQLRDVARRLGPKAAEEARDRLSEAYGGIGDEEGNLQPLTPKQNKRKHKQSKRVQRALEEMEKRNPSLDNHPNLIDVDLSDFEQALDYAKKAGMYAVGGAIGTLELINAILRFGSLEGPN